MGEGPALGTTVSIPLPPGSGHGAYMHAFDQVVLPALKQFRPDLIIVASGLDALSHDTYGRMNLHSGSYRALTQMLMEAADALYSGGLVLCHEGGYSPLLVPFAGLAILETLSGINTQVTDPFRASVETQSYQALAEHQASAIAEAQKVLEFVARN